MTKHRLVRFAFRSAVALVLFGATGISLLAIFLWIDHPRETTLPTPSGRFEVGRSQFYWSGAASSQTAGAGAGGRELIAWIWYPAVAYDSSQSATEYMPAPWRKAMEQHMGRLLTKFLTRDLSRVRTHSVRDADVSPQEKPYPVVLLRAGLAAQTTAYTSIAEDLASHGYVVVGFDAPYRTIVVVLPDGRVIERAPENDADRFSGGEQKKVATRLTQEWSADMSFALDQLDLLNTSGPTGRFYRRLDMDRVGVVGHSLGGASALQFCHDDARCMAGIDLDGAPLGRVIREGVTQPFMFILSEHRDEPDASAVEADIDSIYSRLPASRRLELVIRGANHFGFSDDGAMLKSPLVMSALHKLGMLRLDGRRQLAIATQCTDAFFDVYLKGLPPAELKNVQRYPEVSVR